MSSFLTEVRWDWRRLNENGVFVDYQDKEFDYLIMPVRHRVCVKIITGSREEFCPPSGFWLCLTYILKYRTELFMAGVAPWSTVASAVFRTVYEALYSFPCLREIYGRDRMWCMSSGACDVLTGCRDDLTNVLGNDFNIEDLLSLMTVQEIVCWPDVAEENRAGKRPTLRRTWLVPVVDQEAIIKSLTRGRVSS